MLSSLTPTVIDHVLGNQLFGRIACAADGRVLIEPMMYYYDGYYLYGNTRQGLKTDLLRQNPMVGFEVDEMVAPGVWHSVVIEGIYEELQGDERSYAIYLMGQRKIPLFADEKLPGPTDSALIEQKEIQSIVYRIRILKKSGRCNRLLIE